MGLVKDFLSFRGRTTTTTTTAENNSDDAVPADASSPNSKMTRRTSSSSSNSLHNNDDSKDTSLSLTSPEKILTYLNVISSGDDGGDSDDDDDKVSSPIHKDGSLSFESGAGSRSTTRFANSRSELDQVVGLTKDSSFDGNAKKSNGESRGDQSGATSLGGFEVQNASSSLSGAPGENVSKLASNISLFAISLLKHPTQKDAKKTNHSFEDILIDNLQHHMQLMSTWDREDDESGKVVIDDSKHQSLSAVTNLPDSSFNKKTPEQQLDSKNMEEFANGWIRKCQYQKAFDFYASLLQSSQTNDHQTSLESSERADIWTKLSILSILLGDIATSQKFGKQALKLNRGGGGDSGEQSQPQSQQAEVAVNLLVLGIGKFALRKFDDALKLWREALQRTCVVYGYEHPVNATLLNNIGCLHYHHDNSQQEEDLATSLKTLTESHDLNREVLGGSSSSVSSFSSSNAILLNFAISKANIATIGARSGEYDWASTVLEEVLSLQDSVIDDEEQGNFFTETTRYTIKRLSRRRRESQSSSATTTTTKLKLPQLLGTTSVCATASLATSGRTVEGATTTASLATGSRATFVGGEGTSTANRSDFAAIQSCSSTFHQALEVQVDEVTPSIFGDCDIDGIPMRHRLQGTTQKSVVDATDETVYFNFLMLGPIKHGYTPTQRVRSSVLNWFGKTLQDDDSNGVTKLTVVPFGGTPRKRVRIPVDVDEDAVIDAEFYLKGIIEQATDHLEHDETDEAVELFQSVLVSHVDKYGSVNHLVGTANHNMGLCHMYAQEYVQAKAYFEAAVKIRCDVLGDDHPAVAASLSFIGMIYMIKGNAEQSIETFQKVLKLVRERHGRGNIQAARALNNIAVAQYHQAKYQDSFRTMLKANSMLRKVLRTSHSNVGAPFKQTKSIEVALSYTLCNLAYLHFRQGSYTDAFAAYQEADKLQQKHPGFRFSDGGYAGDNLPHVRNMITDVTLRDNTKQLQRHQDENEMSSFGSCVPLGMTIDEFKSLLRC